MRRHRPHLGGKVCERHPRREIRGSDEDGNRGRWLGDGVYSDSGDECQPGCNDESKIDLKASHDRTSTATT
jgi:hypothetical protein